MLTRKQRELLLYIHGHLSENGVSPSFDEMKDALGLKSKSGIHRLISGLEERGFIRRLAHRARAIEVLRLPEDHDQSHDLGHDTNVIHGVFGRVQRLPSLAESRQVRQLKLCAIPAISLMSQQPCWAIARNTMR